MYQDRNNSPASDQFFPRRRMAEDEEIRERRGVRLWFGGALILTLLAGGVWLGLPYLKKLDSMRNQRLHTEQSLASLAARIGGLSERVSALESEARRRVAGEAALEDALVTLRVGNTSANAAAAETKRYARDLNNRLYSRLRSNEAALLSATATRLSRLEDELRDGRSRKAALDLELARVRQELRQHDSRLAAGEANQYADKQVLADSISKVRHETEDARGAVRTLTRDLSVERVDFELSRNRSQEITDGITLCVTDVDVARRQVKGWLWVLPDRKTIWLRDRNAMQPVVFYTKRDGKRREVVFTSMTTNSVAGYLVLPATTSTQEPVSQRKEESWNVLRTRER